MRGWLWRYSDLLLYVSSFVISLAVLRQATAQGLLPMPTAGTDQLAMLQNAVGIYHGQLPGKDYILSPIYTLFLTGLISLTHGELWWMRLAQAALGALIPVVIYRLALTIRMPRGAALIGALLWCGYGPATLLGLDFLREIPVALCFVTAVWMLASGFIRRSGLRYGLAGVLLGICILGRETYLVVAAVPFALLIWPEFRRQWSWKFCAWYLGGIAVMVLPLMFYNLWRFGVFATIPSHASIGYLLTTFHGDGAARDPLTAITAVVSPIPSQLYHCFALYERDNSLSFYAHREMIPVLRWQPVTYNLLIAAAAVAVWLRRGQGGVRCLVMMTAACLLPLIFLVVHYRFRVHAVPLLCVLAGAGIWATVTAQSWKKAVLLLIVMTGIWGVTWDNVDKLRRPAERWAVVHAMLVNRQYDLAEAYIRKLDRAGVNSIPAKVELVRTLAKDGHADAALRLAREYRLPGLPQP